MFFDLDPVHGDLKVGVDFRRVYATVLERYQERRACVLRTDLDGFVTVRTDGKRLQMDMGRWSGALGSSPVAGLPREF